MSSDLPEVFVVLAGDATLRIAEGPEIELGPGTAVRLHAGDRTTWVVRSPLGKVYVTPPPRPARPRIEAARMVRTRVSRHRIPGTYPCGGDQVL